MTAAGAISFTVDPWDPAYGVAFGEEVDGAMQESTAELDLDLEIPSARWRPLDPNPTAPLPSAVVFLDGVRRIDARIWVHGAAPPPAPGVAASFAAGLVCCDREARVVDVTVERGLFTSARDAIDILTHAARYPARVVDDAGFDQLSLALQHRLALAEVQLALAFRAAHPDGDDLLVVDGPLHGRTHLSRAVGYIKAHHASYLPREQAAIVAALQPGQRTPAFMMGTSWRRNSWYLRLPGASESPWSGVVRLECSTDLPTAEVTRLADITARVLPPLASAAHKDERAPQNLVPIGGLERELRHRLGDQQLLYRALRAAAARKAGSSRETPEPNIASDLDTTPIPLN